MSSPLLTAVRKEVPQEVSSLRYGQVLYVISQTLEIQLYGMTESVYLLYIVSCPVWIMLQLFADGPRGTQEGVTQAHVPYCIMRQRR